MITTLSATIIKLSLILGLLQNVVAAQPKDFIQSIPAPEPQKEVIVVPQPPIWDALSKLAECESGGRRTVKVVDVNSKLSYGTYQFQSATFHAFGEKYGLPHTDIMSRSEQTAIAKRMIENGLWTHWRNCGLKIGLDKLSP